MSEPSREQEQAARRGGKEATAREAERDEAQEVVDGLRAELEKQ